MTIKTDQFRVHEGDTANALLKADRCWQQSIA